MSTVMLGRALRGRLGLYTVTKQLQEGVWLASQKKVKVVLKSADHFRIHNERDVLLRFQNRTNLLRPLIDEIEDSSVPHSIILRYLDDDILQASDKQRLTRPEVKFVAKKVLEGLLILHEEGFVHTDIKPSNVLVNYGEETRFKDVQLADFGSTVRVDSIHAQRGDPIGTPIFRSPEALLQMKWGPSTDIWSFGALLISLLYGEGFHIFSPGVPVDHDKYIIKILLKHHRCFGPFPITYESIADDERLSVLTWIIENSPRETLRPFHLTTTKEICREDKDFVLKMMKLDPRDRPTARQLLEDEWFKEP